MTRGSNPGRVRKFFPSLKHPYWLWGPPSRSPFPEVKRPVRDVNHSHLVPSLRNCGAIPLLPLHGFITSLLFPVLSLSRYLLAFFGLIAVFFHLCISSRTFLLKAVTTKTVIWDMTPCTITYEHRRCLPSPGYTSRTLTKKYRYIYTRLHGVTSHPLLP
jgi:hypothetical protein